MGDYDWKGRHPDLFEEEAPESTPDERIVSSILDACVSNLTRIYGEMNVKAVELSAQKAKEESDRLVEIHKRDAESYRQAREEDARLRDGLLAELRELISATQEEMKAERAVVAEEIRVGLTNLPTPEVLVSIGEELARLAPADTGPIVAAIGKGVGLLVAAIDRNTAARKTITFNRNMRGQIESAETGDAA